MSCSCLQGLDVGEEVLRTDAFGGIGIHAVHVGYALEGTPFRGEEPVDGTVLVHLLVVFPEVLHEILLHTLAEAFLYIVEILDVLFITQCYANEVGKAV